MPFLAPIAAVAAAAVGTGAAIDQASKNNKKSANDPNSPYVDPNKNAGDQARLQGMAQGFLTSGAPNVDRTNLNSDIGLGAESRQQQKEALGLAREAALGNAPSVASKQMEQGIQHSIAAQASSAAGARGGPQALAAAQRAAAMGGAQMQLENVGNQSILRANEMASGRQQYAQQSSDLRARDLMQRGMSADEAFRQANLELQNKTAMGQLALGSEGLSQGYAGMGLKREMGNAGMLQNREQSDRDLAMDITKGGIGLVSSLGGAAAMSDERAKTDIQPAGDSGGAVAKGLGSVGKAFTESMGQHHRYANPMADPYTVSSGIANKTDVKPAVSGNYSAKENAVQNNANEPMPGDPGRGGIIRDNPFQAPPAGPPAGAHSDWDSLLKLFGGEVEQNWLQPQQQSTSPNINAALARSNDTGLAPTMSSDEKGKRKNGGSGVADAFLDTLSKSASTYKYKDQQDEPRTSPTGGHYMGVMAQDLERVPDIGHQLVSEGPRGKQMELGPMVSALAAGLGRLAEKLNKRGG